MSSITSHYGYHMTMWHLVKALSGQQLDLGTTGNHSLSFAPAMACPYSLPVLMVGRLAAVSCAENRFSLSLFSGDPLPLDNLAVAGRPYPFLPATLTPGTPLQWR